MKVSAIILILISFISCTETRECIYCENLNGKVLQTCEEDLHGTWDAEVLMNYYMNNGFDTCCISYEDRIIY